MGGVDEGVDTEDVIEDVVDDVPGGGDLNEYPGPSK